MKIISSNFNVLRTFCGMATVQTSKQESASSLNLQLVVLGWYGVEGERERESNCINIEFEECASRMRSHRNNSYVSNATTVTSLVVVFLG